MADAGQFAFVVLRCVTVVPPDHVEHRAGREMRGLSNFHYGAALIRSDIDLRAFSLPVIGVTIIRPDSIPNA